MCKEIIPSSSSRFEYAIQCVRRTRYQHSGAPTGGRGKETLDVEVRGGRKRQPARKEALDRIKK